MTGVSLALAAIIAAALLLVLAFLRRWLGSARARRRSRRALRGEAEAERLLVRAGYRVCARQPRTLLVLRCDGEDIEILLRADLLVERDGRRHVAEVKTGVEAPALTTSATRRQLLEYLVAYDVDGVLLVDPERGRIREVAFPIVARP